MTIEEMKKWKRTLGMTSEEISSASGIPLSTVQKIFSGVTIHHLLTQKASVRTDMRLSIEGVCTGRMTVPDIRTGWRNRQAFIELKRKMC